jgi:glycosyltransferase involved in cell wall biosynthesis
VRAVFFTDTPQRLAGAQKSLLAAVTRARAMGICVPIMVMPARGLFSDACEREKLETRILEGSAAYHSFGRALLKIGAVGQARVMLREVLPYARRIADLIEHERADAVHFNTARGAIMAGPGAHLARRGSVLHLRGTPRFERKYWLVAQAIPDRIILVAKALEADLLPSVQPRGRVVYNGIALRPRIPRDEARRQLVATGVVSSDAFERGLVFASLSSIVPFKGLHHLAHAVAKLEGSARHAVFLLAGMPGVGPYEAWLHALVAKLGVAERMRFLGFVADPHVLLCASDALVLPSVERELLDMNGIITEVDGNEGLPRSILEAMAAGIPSIASDVAGVREQIEDGRNGLVVPPGDASALASAISRLEGDAELRVRMIERGTEVVRERFSIDAAANGLVRTLEEARDEATLARTALRVAATFGDVVRARASA